MKIEKLKISDLIPYVKNARVHPQKQIDLLARNIEKFGFTVPVLVDDRNVIIAGHGRLIAMKQLGRDEVPCVRMEKLTDEEINALRLADNQIATMAEWDMTLALDELKGLSDSLFDLTGFDRDLLIEPNEMDDVIPENVPVRTNLGDLYELGRHRLLCGDSTQFDAVLHLMNGHRANLFITDPPYGVSYASKNESLNAIGKGNRIQTPIEGDHQTSEGMKDLWVSTFKNAYKNTTDESCYYINAMQGGDLMMMMMSILESGYNLKHMMIWVKNNHVLGRMDYHYQHEPIFYGWKEGKSHKWFGGHSQTSVWKVDKPMKNDLHPTMKPVELICKAIFNSSNANDLILDLFLGSGSTLIACEKTNRICYGMEIDPHYCDVIVQRYVDYADNPVVKLNGKIISWEKTKKKTSPTSTPNSPVRRKERKT